MQYFSSLVNKTILVTGASSGIGRATALYCAQLGARLVITGRDKNHLNKTKELMTAGNHISITMDLTSQDSLESFFETINEQTGLLDGMVHCAGIPGVIPLRSLSRMKLEKIMDINFYSFVELVRQFGKRKYSRDGASVVGMSAALVRHPRAYEMAYIASKAALEAVVPVMAMELKKRKIRVNCLCPGSVRTEMVEKTVKELGTEGNLDNLSRVSILGWQTPDEIAQVCAFLLSDSASAITARTIQADGGYL